MGIDELTLIITALSGAGLFKMIESITLAVLGNRKALRSELREEVEKLEAKILHLEEQVSDLEAG